MIVRSDMARARRGRRKGGEEEDDHEKVNDHGQEVVLGRRSSWVTVRGPRPIDDVVRCFIEATFKHS